MRMPSSIPFSRSMPWIPSMISWLMSLPLVDQVRPHDRAVRDVQLLGARRDDGHDSLARSDHLAAEPTPAARPVLRANRDLPPDRGREMGRLPERALRP